MSLSISKKQLSGLLQDFYLLTEMKIVVFDEQFNEILNYPDRHCELCKIVRENPERLACCNSSDQRAFEECKQSGNPVIYHCHAGLIEATAPIKSNGIIIGYIMFGQVTDQTDKNDLAQAVTRRFDIPETEKLLWRNAAEKIKYKQFSQITAAAKILEACTYYVLQKELVSIKQERLIDKINQYIEDNLDQDIHPIQLAQHFHVSRTKMYEITNTYLGMGIAEYIRKKRLEKGKKLLSETSLSVSVIADLTGFSDYTYFSKSFKKEYLLAPHAFRKKYNSR